MTEQTVHLVITVTLSISVSIFVSIFVAVFVPGEAEGRIELADWTMAIPVKQSLCRVKRVGGVQLNSVCDCLSGLWCALDCCDDR